MGENLYKDRKIFKNLNSLHKLDASTIVKEICKRIDGGGGGQQNFASGSGKLNIDSDELKNICKKYFYVIEPSNNFVSLLTISTIS